MIFFKEENRKFKKVPTNNYFAELKIAGRFTTAKLRKDIPGVARLPRCIKFLRGPLFSALITHLFRFKADVAVFFRPGCCFVGHSGLTLKPEKEEADVFDVQRELDE